MGSFLFILVIGAAVYEHMAVVPRWSAAPPVSLTMFQGPYGLNPGAFWQVIHPITFVVLLATTLLHWKTARKSNLLVTLSIYFAILVITGVYFVPELLSIIQTPLSNVPDPQLKIRADLWELLSLVRLLTMVLCALLLMKGLTKPGTVQTKVGSYNKATVLA